MGMDNVFPGIGFNPEVHGRTEMTKPELDISWNQEVILVQKEFSLVEFDRLQKIKGKDPLFKGQSKEFIVEQYRKILDENTRQL